MVECNATDNEAFNIVVRSLSRTYIHADDKNKSHRHDVSRFKANQIYPTRSSQKCHGFDKNAKSDYDM